MQTCPNIKAKINDCLDKMQNLRETQEFIVKAIILVHPIDLFSRSVRGIEAAIHM